MNAVKLAWKNMLHQPGQALLMLILSASGVFVLSVLFLVGKQTQRHLSANTQGIDLVVGAKGSPLQLILCNVFHLDFPTGNIPLKEAAGLARNPFVKSAVPLALGDSYQGARIVGSTHSIFEVYQAEVEEGQVWDQHMQAVVGASLAKRLGLSIGSAFHGQHGLAMGGETHEHQEYTVVGILQATGTVADQLIFCSIPSVWMMHAHQEQDKTAPTPKHQEEGEHETNSHGHEPCEHEHDHGEEAHRHDAHGLHATLADLYKHHPEQEVTSLLLSFKNPMGALQVPRMVDTQTSMQAAAPAFQLARLSSLFQPVRQIVQGASYFLMAVALLSIFLSIYYNLSERKRELAVLRATGASRLYLAAVLLIEGMGIALMGALLGLGAAHTVLYLIKGSLEPHAAAMLQPGIFYSQELIILGGGLVMGFLSALLPAFRAFRMNISATLKQ